MAKTPGTGGSRRKRIRRARLRPRGRWLTEPDVIRELRRNWQRTLLLATITGVVTGLGVALFEWLAFAVLLEGLLEQRLGYQLVAPGAGLLVAVLVLRWLARRTSPSTSDEYVNYFHDRHRTLPLWPLPGRMVASVATLGGGGALGFEGPSIYLGASVGTAVQRRFRHWFSREEAKVMMVAGAAAGVAAIFKTPLTGAVFALEVPYRRDLAARAVLPALVGSATSYFTFVAFQGTTPLLNVWGNPQFSLVDLAEAALLGILCGLGARGFAAMVAWSKDQARHTRMRLRLPIAAVGLLGLAAGAYAVYDATLTLGPGYSAIVWASTASDELGLVALLFGMRVAATGLTIYGGGAGGVFVPLVVAGALLGQLVGGVFGETESSLFPLVGMAAFLGAGYRTPIAAVTFVVETTTQAGFVVPGLIAAVLAEQMMGDESVTPYQQVRRTGHLERRLRLPITAALERDVVAVGPRTSLDELLNEHFVAARARSVPVVNEGRYVGMVRIEEVEQVPRADYETTHVGEVMLTDLPAAELSWNLRRAIAVMEERGVSRLGVCDHGRLVGVVTTSEILRLDEILDETDV